VTFQTRDSHPWQIGASHLPLFATVEGAVIALEEFLMPLVKVNDLISNLWEIIIIIVWYCLKQVVFIQVFPDFIEILSS